MHRRGVLTLSGHLIDIEVDAHTIGHDQLIPSLVALVKVLRYPHLVRVLRSVDFTSQTPLVILRQFGIHYCHRLTYLNCNSFSQIYLYKW